MHYIAFKGMLTSVLQDYKGQQHMLCYVAISDAISARADFQVDGYHGYCVSSLVILIHNTLQGRDNDQ